MYEYEIKPSFAYMHMRIYGKSNIVQKKVLKNDNIEQNL